jgi:hypothetical protein
VECCREWRKAANTHGPAARRCSLGWRLGRRSAAETRVRRDGSGTLAAAVWAVAPGLTFKIHRAIETSLVGCCSGFLINSSRLHASSQKYLSYRTTVSSRLPAWPLRGVGLGSGESRGRGVTSLARPVPLPRVRGGGEGRARRNAFAFGARTRGTGSDRRAVQLVHIHTRERLTSSPPHLLTVRPRATARDTSEARDGNWP